MLRRILKALFKGIFRSRRALVGSVLVAVTFPVLLIFTFLDVQGMVSNPYFSFINYAVLGPLSVVGVVLLGVGLLTGEADEDIGLFAYEYLKDQLAMPGRFSRIRKMLIMVTSITLFTIFVVAVISYTSLKYTDSTSFCGQFCHSVMEPQYRTYKNSPHSRVTCVACHFEQGEWSAGTKLSGIRQIFAVVLNTYPRPITAPATHLRPTRKSCEQCHLPEKFHGEKLYVKDRFLPDEHNSHRQTVLLMKVGSGGVYRGGRAHGIHWHVASENKLMYRAVDRKRTEISEVRLQKKDGSEVVYAAGNGKFAGVGELRVMDCIDCHNRPTHVFLSKDEALDRKLLSGAIS
ncbi:MAG: NapC/NirT family cytochrome c, partial [Desulfobulbaceae bacterium]|nr:NapC/NirT family cytochrome c [Desulfobulbaceae bacterium]